jgi:hypothetical protein
MKKAVPTNAAITAADLLDAVAKNVRLSPPPANLKSSVEALANSPRAASGWKWWIGSGGRSPLAPADCVDGTIGRVVTVAEQGKAKPGERPSSRVWERTR